LLEEEARRRYGSQMPIKIGPPDSHHLNAAQGWLELNNPAEAEAELQQVSSEIQTHPEVLALRWEVHAKARNWQKCVEVANRLVEIAPKIVQGWIHRSYALHELKRTREALDALLPAAPIFPKDWLIQYNLACYCCRLEEFDRSRSFLRQALKLGDAKEIKEMALADADLKKLRAEIAGM
jgi:tetratricopeptide (TPR) repeat protein